MHAILFFTCIFSFTLGFSSFVVLFLLSLKYRYWLIRLYYLFIASISLLFLIETIDNYIYMTLGVSIDQFFPIVENPLPFPMQITIVFHYLLYSGIVSLLPVRTVSQSPEVLFILTNAVFLYCECL